MNTDDHLKELDNKFEFLMSAIKNYSINQIEQLYESWKKDHSLGNNK